MAIQVNRTGSDSVEIFADDSTYYVVRYSPVDEKWHVTKDYRNAIGFGTSIGSYPTAKDAIENVKKMLAEKESELTDAIEELL